MAVRCSSCGQEYDAALFEMDRWILCDCGVPVSRVIPQILSSHSEDPSREKMHELGRLADRICVHILDQDYPPEDIAIERSRLRELALEWFPESEELFEMVYESRFDRLIEQWRGKRCP